MVPLQAIIGVIGVLLAALYVANKGCGGWGVGGLLGEGGGATLARGGCGGASSCGRKARGCLGIVMAEGGSCGG